MFVRFKTRTVGDHLLPGRVVVVLEPLLQLRQLRFRVEADPHPRLHVSGRNVRVEPERSGSRAREVPGRIVAPEKVVPFGGLKIRKF